MNKAGCHNLQSICEICLLGGSGRHGIRSYQQGHPIFYNIRLPDLDQSNMSSYLMVCRADFVEKCEAGTGKSFADGFRIELLETQ